MTAAGLPASIVLALVLGCVSPARVVTPTAGPSAPTAPVDRDGDGLVDAADLCPDLPEDCDGYHDEDGCPDKDNDDDGISDVCDQCPNDPETWNDNADDDGCPDQALVIIRNDSLRIIEHVFFAAGSARVESVSLPLLDEVAKVMLTNPQLELVRIVGNASMGEPAAAKLSERRARAVRDLLVQRGVATERLEISGEGTNLPLSPNTTDAARAQNRRVDFVLVRRTPQPEPQPPEHLHREPSRCEGPPPGPARPCRSATP